MQLIHCQKRVTQECETYFSSPQIHGHACIESQKCNHYFNIIILNKKEL